MRGQGRIKLIALTMAFLFLMGVEIAYPYNAAEALEPVYNAPYSPVNSDTDSSFPSKLVKLIKSIFGIGKSVHAQEAPEKVKGEKGVRGLEQSLEEIEDALENINESLEDGTDYSADLDKLASERQAIEALDVEIKSKFAETEATLLNLSARGLVSNEILERHYNLTSKYDEGIITLSSSISEIEKTTNKKKLKEKVKSAREHVKKIKHEKKEKFLSSDQLPHRSVYQETETITLSESISPGYTYGYDLINLSGAVNDTLPVAADLNGTVEVQITPEIEDLAEMLGHDPVRIYEYVRNNFEYEPYSGSLKGSQETLWEEGGNDVDLASLLIALYRASGIPARYTYGTIEMPIEQAMNLVGVEDERTAGNVFASGGVPGVLVIEGGEISKLVLGHVWVEAYIPYANYRGNIRSEGGFAWIPLDPSFKQYEYHKPVVNLTEAMEMNASEFLNGIMDQSVINESASYITSMNQSYIQEQMEGYTNNTLGYLEANNLTNATLNDILGHRTIIKEELGILPNSLPYMSSKLAAYSDVPDDMRHKIKFEIYGNATTLAMPELAGKRITLSYLPATEDDAALIEEYGGITEVPAYLVEMIPVLRVEGEAVAVGAPGTLGERQQFVMEFQMPGGGRDRVANDVTVGAYYAVGLNVGKVPARLLEEHNSRLKTWINLINSSLVDFSNVSIDDTTGELLYITALAYFGELDTYTKFAAYKHDMVWSRQPSEGIVSIGLSVSYLFWSPYNVDVSGLNIDVDRNIFMPFSKTGDTSATKEFMISTGMIGSSMEHTIFEQIFFLPSVSAMKILAIASSQNIPIYTINSENIDTTLPTLQVSDAVKNSIQSAVSLGREVTIPEKEIHYFNWTGTGWIEMDQDSGSAAYMISGGLAGGSTALDKCLWDIGTLLAGSIPGGAGYSKTFNSIAVIVALIGGDVGTILSGSGLALIVLLSLLAIMIMWTLLLFAITFYLSFIWALVITLIFNFFFTWMINIALTEGEGGVGGAMPLKACLDLL